MLQRVFAAIFGLVLTFTFYLAPAAHAEDWVKMGSAHASANDGAVTIAITTSTQWRMLRVSASDRSVTITRIVAEPGGITSVGPGARMVSVGGRAVQSVTVRYRTRLAREATFTIDVFGLPARDIRAKKKAKPSDSKLSASETEKGLGIGGTGAGGGGSGTGSGQIGSPPPAGASRGGAQGIDATRDNRATEQTWRARRYEMRRDQPGSTDRAAAEAPRAPAPPAAQDGRDSDGGIAVRPTEAAPTASRPTDIGGPVIAGGAPADEEGANRGLPDVPAPPPPRPARRAPASEAPREPAASEPAAAAPPPAAEPARTATAEASPAANVCQDKKVCTPVGVFFGTDRDAQTTPTRVVFGAERFDKLTLGHAFVTVPKARKTGEIPLPSLWDIYVRRIPETGDPARHFTIPPGGISLYDGEDSFIAAVKQHMTNAGTFKDHAFVFVHGFRVAFDEALFRTAQIAYDLSGDGVPFGTPFLYSWPSAADARAYLFDEDSARLAIPHLEKFLRLVIDKTGAKHVHLIAHSMGNVPLINALKNVATAENQKRINQVVLAAPDFDKKEFEKIAASIIAVADNVTLYASSSDYAMKVARRARRDTPRAGDATTPPGPAIADGIDTVDVSVLDSSIFSWNHNHYAESSELISDMSKMFREGLRPPAVRSPNFKPQTTGAGQFWRWVK